MKSEAYSKLLNISKETRAWAIAELRRRINEDRERRRFFDLFPDEGPFRRELYPKHLEFFEAGAKYRERCFMGANRTGKTVGCGGYETVCHLTGLYPAWWPGKKFDRPVRGWAAGRTNETTRDIIQRKLFGDVVWRGGDKTVRGNGLVPGELIGDASWKQGVQDLLDTVLVLHVTGRFSVLGLKSYQQGRGSFEGTEQDFIWLDEECPPDVYGECIVRTAATDGNPDHNGLVYTTFTPLEGMSDVVMSFLPKEARLTA